MARTSVILCLSSGLAINDKLMSIFVQFSGPSWPFESLAFFENGAQSSNQSSQTGCF